MPDPAACNTLLDYLGGERLLRVKRIEDKPVLRQPNFPLRSLRTLREAPWRLSVRPFSIYGLQFSNLEVRMWARSDLRNAPSRGG